jgi:hypothetical protein
VEKYVNLQKASLVSEKNRNLVDCANGRIDWGIDFIRAAWKTSKPAPEPRSSTVSPWMALICEHGYTALLHLVELEEQQSGKDRGKEKGFNT